MKGIIITGCKTLLDRNKYLHILSTPLLIMCLFNISHCYSDNLANLFLIAMFPIWVCLDIYAGLFTELMYLTINQFSQIFTLQF